jgi:hypothetical protein
MTMTTINTRLTWRRTGPTKFHDLFAGKVYIGWVNGASGEKWAGHLCLDGDGDTLDLPLRGTLREARTTLEQAARRALEA